MMRRCCSCWCGWGTVWVLLYLVVLSLILYWSLLFSSLHAAAFLTLVYVSYYLVAYSGDGIREWKWLRSHPIWDRLCPYQVICIDPNEFFQGEQYLLLDARSICSPLAETDGGGGDRNMSLWAFGLYGKRLPFAARLQPIVCLPRSVFYIPYLTDALQWAGCIADGDADVAWETRSSVVVSVLFEGLLRLDRTLLSDRTPVKIALFRHDMRARCTLVGAPIAYTGAETDFGELERRAAALNAVLLVNSFHAEGGEDSIV